MAAFPHRMTHSEESPDQVARRLDELARRTQETGLPFFSAFLSPAEAEIAQRCANRNKINVLYSGGWEDAERQMACFCCDDEQPDFPISILRICWPRQEAPRHQDLLGSVLGLGIKRSCIGDIVPESTQAYLFCESRMAPAIEQGLTSAGRISLQTEQILEVPDLAPQEGTELHETVAGLRFDAVLAAGFNLSRSDAAEMITSGKAKLRHVPNTHVDARVAQNDVLSLRGYGRLKVEEIGTPNRKGRLPLRLIRYGNNKK